MTLEERIRAYCQKCNYRILDLSQILLGACMSGELVAHRGAQIVTREDLKAYVIPEATGTFKPVGHSQSDTPGKAGGLMSRAASKAVDLTTCVLD